MFYASLFTSSSERGWSGADGIVVIGESATDNSIVGNEVGYNQFGEQQGNGEGISIKGGQNNYVANNVISGNPSDGVDISDASAHGTGGGNVISGNTIGAETLSFAQVRPTANGYGIVLKDADDTTIGGVSPAAANTIVGNKLAGINIYGASESNKVIGNFIGTNADDSDGLGNPAGVVVKGPSAQFNVIGDAYLGASASACTAGCNVISGNSNVGIWIQGAKSVTVRHNFIGTTAAGNPGLGNKDSGILVGPETKGSTVDSDSVIGGGSWGNTIAGTPIGVHVLAGARGVKISQNSIFASGKGGIVLDDGSGSSGSGNGGEAAPEAFSANIAAKGGTSVSWALNRSDPHTALTLEFFASPACDKSGKTYLGSQSVTTNGDGFKTGDAMVARAVAGQFVTATSTSALSGTSEFSGCARVTSTVKR